jgi:hypothetical protein
MLISVLSPLLARVERAVAVVGAAPLDNLEEEPVSDCLGEEVQ